MCYVYICLFFFQVEDGIRDLVRSRGLGDVYKRQAGEPVMWQNSGLPGAVANQGPATNGHQWRTMFWSCLLYTSDAADERSSVDLGGRRIIKKKKSKSNQL